MFHAPDIAAEATSRQPVSCLSGICQYGHNGESGAMLRIKELRNARSPRMTVAELAEAAGLDQSVVSRYENGKRWPSGENLALIAEVLGVQPHELISSYTPPPPHLSEIQKMLDHASDEDVRKAAELIRVLCGEPSQPE